MEGYLKQIAGRNYTEGHELKPVPKQEDPGSSALHDPFEEVSMQNSLPEPAVQTTAISIKETPVNKNAVVAIPQTSYLSRHIIKSTDERLEAEKSSPKKNIPVKEIEFSGKPVSNITKTETFNRPANIEKKISGENNNEKEPGRTVGDIPERKQQPVQIIPRAMMPFQAAAPINIKKDSVPFIQPALTKEQSKPEKQPVATPLLSIGRITIEILPEAKPQVIQKIEKRIVAQPSQPTPNLNRKFVFGLGQL